jgi:flagellar motor switch/type III secretory pathway protein FliN
MNPQPFSWHLVSHTTHENVRALQDVRRLLEHRGDSDRVLARFAELARSKINLRLREAQVGNASPRKGCVAVALGDDQERRVVVIAENALAATAVMRAMKRAPPLVIDPNRAAPASLAGAFAAFLVAASRASDFGPLHVAWCGDAGDLSAAQLPARVVDVRATVAIDDTTFEAHLYASEDAVRSAPNRDFTSSDLIALDSLPIALFVVASAATASSAEIAELQIGDAWLPGEFLARGDSAKFFGDVVLASANAERGVRARIEEDGSLVYVEGAEEIAMSALIENVGDASVVVRVEIGSVTLTAREWSALKAGDVMTASQKISDPVVLRVGGVEVARGELVEVEGQVGVRILSRA